MIKIESIKEERVDVSGINWEQFTDETIVQFQDNYEKTLTLANWSQTIYREAPAIQFDVTQEDGEAVKKTLTTKSKRLIRQLRPLITRALSSGKHEIHVGITRTGSGYDTDYQVKEML